MPTRAATKPDIGTEPIDHPVGPTTRMRFAQPHLIVDLKGHGHLRVVPGRRHRCRKCAGVNLGRWWT
jgi:hypothetical protein